MQEDPGRETHERKKSPPSPQGTEDPDFCPLAQTNRQKPRAGGVSLNTYSGRSSGSPHCRPAFPDAWASSGARGAQLHEVYGGGSAPGLHGIPYQALSGTRMEASLNRAQEPVNALLYFFENI